MKNWIITSCSLIYLFFTMSNKKNLFIIIFVISFILINCYHGKSVYNREKQLFYLFNQNNIDRSHFTGFVFILKSFGCSRCEELTYSLLNNMVNDLKYKNRGFVLISLNDENLIRDKIYNYKNKEIKFFILDDLLMARLGLVYPYDVLIEIKQGEIINHNMIDDSTIKKLNKRYL